MPSSLRIHLFTSGFFTNFVDPHLTALHLSVSFDRVVETFRSHHTQSHTSAMPRWTAFVCPLIGAGYHASDLLAAELADKEPST